MEFFKNMPIGQYIPGDSFVHRLDPRSKILLVFFYVIMIFVANNALGLTTFGLITAIAIWASKVSPTYLWRGLKGMLLLILLIGIMQFFFVKEGDLLWAWGWFSIYSEGLIRAIMITLRLLFLILLTSLLTLTTSPMELTDGLESLLRPLNRIKFPVHELALMMTIALRYIPTLMDETEKIIKAQTARGADFESKNFFTRLRALFPLLVPLFISSFRRAEDLALAMEARCYRGGEGRTRRKVMEATWRDGIVALLILIMIVTTLLLRFLL